MANSLELFTAQTERNKAEFDLIQAKYNVIFRSKIIDYYLEIQFNSITINLFELTKEMAKKKRSIGKIILIIVVLLVVLGFIGFKAGWFGKERLLKSRWMS
jgi:hypothetical protein